MKATAACGFSYELAFRRNDGILLAADLARNRVPLEGLDLITSAIFKAGAVPAPLYIGLWSGSYVPTGAETAATLASLVTEVTGYEGTARKQFVPGVVSNGGVSNAGSLATFNFDADATVNGAFISSAPAKGATNGTLLSVVRFPNPRTVDAAVYLEILSGFQFISM